MSNKSIEATPSWLNVGNVDGIRYVDVKRTVVETSRKGSIRCRSMGMRQTDLDARETSKSSRRSFRHRCAICLWCCTCTLSVQQRVLPQQPRFILARSRSFRKPARCARTFAYSSCSLLYMRRTAARQCRMRANRDDAVANRSRSNAYSAKTQTDVGTRHVELSFCAALPPHFTVVVIAPCERLCSRLLMKCPSCFTVASLAARSSAFSLHEVGACFPLKYCQSHEWRWAA